VHAHCVVALSDGSTKGGHLVEAHVSLEMQIFVTDDSEPESPARLRRAGYRHVAVLDFSFLIFPEVPHDGRRPAKQRRDLLHRQELEAEFLCL
jgi:hypothetical protein